MMNAVAFAETLALAAFSAAEASAARARANAAAASRRTADAAVIRALADQGAVIETLLVALRDERHRAAQLERLVDDLRDEIDDLEGELVTARGNH
ncbi:hypothetical protein HL658_20070 [Azospirillum sp. RWY-5-1]|uniref:Uncharacterized protein n=1 Tax=Azospirillum oleiclasticum TaxID=2735135 RepID=A0ABX2TCU4_9PROT|nr:hypothetical protein [Azospirillum oleiclasticum]NYZ14848.1 hypothetical protein [Azospirillum oleiclasticum]NYZ22166.1 hypothetical protein [Azospirillum oleiclasticum]